MIYVVIIVAVIVGIISYIVEDGGLGAKLALACFVAIFAFLLLRLITGIVAFTTLAKICGAAVVIISFGGIIRRIFD